jgi:hypothetical protein
LETNKPKKSNVSVLKINTVKVNRIMYFSMKIKGYESKGTTEVLSYTTVLRKRKLLHKLEDACTDIIHIAGKCEFVKDFRFLVTECLE